MLEKKNLTYVILKPNLNANLKTKLKSNLNLNLILYLILLVECLIGTEKRRKNILSEYMILVNGKSKNFGALGI